MALLLCILICIQPNEPKRLQQRSILFNKALKSKNLEFFDFSVIARSDQLELWQLCESRYAPMEKSSYEKKQLERDFETMKKGTNEDFLKRVEIQASNLVAYGIFCTD